MSESRSSSSSSGSGKSSDSAVVGAVGAAVEEGVGAAAANSVRTESRSSRLRFVRLVGGDAGAKRSA